MKKSNAKKFDINKVPFVPAFDLLENEKNRLSDKEAACVALSLYLSLGQENNLKSKWELFSRQESLNQRL